jgi:hypothetical protein
MTKYSKKVHEKGALRSFLGSLNAKQSKKKTKSLTSFKKGNDKKVFYFISPQL